MRATNLALALLAATMLTACAAPVVLGGAATAGYIGLQDRPVAQTAEDTKIKVTIMDAFAKKNFNFFTDVSIDVFYGDVLLTGIVPDAASGEQVLQIVRSVPGVKKVYNELFVGSSYPLRQKATDGWILAQLQPRLLGAKDAYPLNYLLSVTNSHVYIIGSVAGADEHEHVLHILRTTRGVVQVHDYLTIENPEDTSRPGLPASTRGSVTVGGRTYQTTSPDPLTGAGER